MRLSIVLILILLFSYASYSQVLTKIDQDKYESFRKKSRRAKQTGLLITCCSGGLILVALPFGMAESPGNPNTAELKRMHKTAAIFFLSGIGIGLSSIPFFIKGHKYSKKAYTIKFHTQLTNMMYPNSKLKYSTESNLNFSVSMRVRL